MQNNSFRYDINGLRAIAVIAVVLFHFNASWMPGGFAGVDVFFVISGFLMTGIIFRGIEQENFSILKFYVARANRIIPALAVLCLALLVFGWFYLTPLDYKALGKHASSSVAFLSNIIYWRESGYFDAASHEKWLLHTWSLSVEWQFYILYPLMLVAMRKFMSIKTMKFLLLVGTVLGFVFCVIATYKWPNPSYYLLPTRAWEMMIGGVAYLYPFTPQENRKKIIEFIGLFLIIGSYFLISSENIWPGYLAIFPVLGSFLLIQANRNNSVVTNNLVFQKLGTWSYSIYLWHWPIVVAIYIFSLSEIYTYLGVILSIFLGFISYKYIEKIKFRDNFSNIFSYLKCKPIYISGTLGILGVIIFIKQDTITPLRLTNEKISIVEQQKRDPRESACGNVINGVSPGCTYGNGPIKAIILGDSHAQAQNVALGKKAETHGGSILSLSMSGCATVKNGYTVDKNGNNPNYNCSKLVSNNIKISAINYPNVPVIIINRIAHHYQGVIEQEDYQLAPPSLFVDKFYKKRTQEYKDNITNHMINTICEITKSNPVYLVRPTPELIKNVPNSMFRHTNFRVKITRNEYNQRQKDVFKMQEEAAKKCGAKILDPIPYLCSNKYCYGDINNIPLYFDDDHLSSYGATLISPIYDEVFR